jgi:hypothetical protein
LRAHAAASKMRTSMRLHPLLISTAILLIAASSGAQEPRPRQQNMDGLSGDDVGESGFGDDSRFAEQHPPLGKQRSRLRRLMLGLTGQRVTGWAGGQHATSTDAMASVSVQSRSWSGTLTNYGAAYMMDYAALGELGGGDGGLAWHADVSASAGARSPYFIRGMGPFGRIVAIGQSEHNGVVSLRRLGLPQIEVGQQLSRRPWLFEFALIGTLWVAAKYTLQDFEARGSTLTPSAGARLTFSWRNGYLWGSYRRTFLNDDAGKSAWDEVDARLCGDAPHVAVCTWARMNAVDVRPGPDGGSMLESRAWSIGLSAGYGMREWSPIR